MEEPAGRVKVSELLLSLLERAHSAQDCWLADMPSFAACFYRSWRNVTALVLMLRLITLSSWHALDSVQSQIRCLSKDEDSKGCADMSKGKTVSVAF